MPRALPALAFAMFLCGSVAAETALDAVVTRAVSEHVLPRVSAFEESATALQATSETDCAPTSPALYAAYHAAFDGWAGISHLRFGPTEADDRAFAIAFWPDGRGKTPKALTALLTGDPAILQEPVTFRQVSIAARGLYALEYLLFDPAIMAAGTPETRCALIRAIAWDVARNGSGIAQDWRSDYAERLTETGPDHLYRSDAEAAQELFKALSTGLQFTAEARLGRPLGTFDRPRPKRAELRRSERALRQVVLSLEATRELALILAASDADLSGDLAQAFDRALEQADRLNDPALAGVAEPQTRFKVEALQQAVNDIRALVAGELGPLLGVAAGFNSLDGD